LAALVLAARRGGEVAQDVAAVVVEQGVGSVHRLGAAEGVGLGLVDRLDPPCDPPGVMERVELLVEEVRCLRRGVVGGQES
jgi:hypothetical protein